MPKLPVSVSVESVKRNDALTNNVYDKEDGTLARLHGQVATVLVTCYGVPGSSLHKEVIDGGRGTQHVVGGVGGQGKNDDDDEQNERVSPIRQNGGPETSNHGVGNDADREKVNFKLSVLLFEEPWQLTHWQQWCASLSTR